MIRAATVTLALLAAGPAFAKPTEGSSCTVKLAASEKARALAGVMLQEENERADAQVYLTRLELSVTKQKLAAALSKCGVACGPAVTPH